jgi:hypothetical protein
MAQGYLASTASPMPVRCFAMGWNAVGRWTRLNIDAMAVGA